MSKYTIVGDGSGVGTSPTAIRQALSELKGEFAVGWYGKPAPAMKAVYDYLMKEEIKFTLVTSSTVPRIFNERDHVTVEDASKKDGGQLTVLAQMTPPEEDGGTALILTPSDDEVAAFLEASAAPAVLDLADGLRPINLEVEDDTPSMPKRSAYMPGQDGEAAWVADYERWENAVEEKQPVPVAPEAEEEDDEEVNVDGFNEEQLLGLSLRILKRIAQGKNPGAHVTTKEEAISLILGGEEPEVASETDEVAEEDTGWEFSLLGLVNAAISEALRVTKEHPASREAALAQTKLEEAAMWLERVR